MSRVLTTDAAAAGITAPLRTPEQRRRGRRLQRLLTFGSWKLRLGLGVVTAFVLVAAVGPLLLPGDPNTMSNAILQSPSSAHWLGTTQTGQDVLRQVVDGARISLLVGFGAGILATIVSVLVGLTAGYVGGWVGEGLSTLTNIVLVLPALPLLIVIAGYLPSKGALPVAIVISVTSWAYGARAIRVQTLSMRRREYVQAARVSGEPLLRILLFEMLPSEIALVASSFIFTVIAAILAEAGLAFLGLSNISEVTWGTMLYWAQNDNALLVGAWWWFVPPGLCIAVVGAGLALCNFGIDELVNPRLRTRVRVPRSLRRALPARARA